VNRCNKGGCHINRHSFAKIFKIKTGFTNMLQSIIKTSFRGQGGGWKIGTNERMNGRTEKQKMFPDCDVEGLMAACAVGTNESCAYWSFRMKAYANPVE
jgi:hypothetical protein